MDKEKLISCVFMREPIWNKENKYHHHSFVLAKLWKEVAEECETTVTIAKARWKNLRFGFKNRLASTSTKHSGDGFEEDYNEQTNWQYFDSLLFLKDQWEAKESTGNVPKQEDETSTSSSEDRGDEGEAPNMDEVSFHQTTDFSRQILPADTSSFRPFPKKSKKDIEIDEDEAFFKSTLPYVRALTPKQKLTFRINVMQLLYNEISSTTQPTDQQTTAELRDVSDPLLS
ncbi:uncharacterized protein LOC126889614 [Diabrotica virgifera virgifera]|uniref:Transcription factor Adf-1-like n=1 Tax=Diabrotica virgifera virgifera TaxID=50390 RepID=A0ABM5KV27_DIAVI|nr:uncharacterized protein LOC126889614 [Diabrotica virgifera virgifera]